MRSAFVRMDNVAATFAMGVNDPAPVIPGNGAAIAPSETCTTELVSDDFPVLHVLHRLRQNRFTNNEEEA